MYGNPTPIDLSFFATGARVSCRFFRSFVHPGVPYLSLAPRVWFFPRVDHDKVFEGLTSLKEAGICPKWLVLDDGWQSTSNVDANNGEFVGAYHGSWGGEGGVYSIGEMYSGLMHGHSRMTIGRSRMTIDPRKPYNGGTEHVGFSPTRQALLAPRAKHREVSSESHEG